MKDYNYIETQSIKSYFKIEKKYVCYFFKYLFKDFYLIKRFQLICKSLKLE